MSKRILAALVLTIALVGCGGNTSEKAGLHFTGSPEGADHAQLADLIIEVCGR